MLKKQQQKCILVDWEKFCLSPKRFIQAQDEKLHWLWNGIKKTGCTLTFLKDSSQNQYELQREQHTFFKKRGGGYNPLEMAIHEMAVMTCLFLSWIKNNNNNNLLRGTQLRIPWMSWVITYWALALGLWVQ